MSRRWVGGLGRGREPRARGAAHRVGGGHRRDRRTATSVTVTAGKPTEFHFTLSKKSVAKGTVTFTIKNSGKLAHDFKIAGKTSTMVKPGKSTTLKVTLKAGSSSPCTLPGHAAAGMRGTLTVK